jgi:hypothetical protein
VAIKASESQSTLPLALLGPSSGTKVAAIEIASRPIGKLT